MQVTVVNAALVRREDIDDLLEPLFGVINQANIKGTLKAMSRSQEVAA